MTKPTLEHAHRLAERLLGRGAERIEPFRPKVGGDDSYSFRLWAGGEAMLLKVKRRPGSPIGVYFHERIQEACVPAPELCAFDAAGGPEGQACAIWKWIDGVPAEWGAGQPCPYDEAELGRILRRIHDLEFGGPFGFLSDDPSQRTFSYTPDMPPTAPNWQAFWTHGYRRAAGRYCDKGYLTRPEADALASLPARIGGLLDAAPCRVLHMSDIMHNGNLILEPGTGRILAVIDYVESLAGDPRWELAWFDYYFVQYPFHDEQFDMARFRAAYGTDHNPDDALGRFYLSAALLFEKLLYFDPASARGRWAIQTVKQVIADLADGDAP